ncbi:MAG: hypothetical protein GC206_00070 [Alphaproteobacteria bacterium]|nr:hypothetical protein [Alphaproteobacteria bacterium]
MTRDRVVDALLEVFRTGSGAPARARLSSGEEAVLKFSGAGGGPRALLTEFIALRVAREFGVAAPAAYPVWLPEDFPWQTGTDEFDDVVRRSRGWNLAIAYIPDASPIAGDALDALPDDFIRPLMIADMMLANVDRTRKNPNLLRDAEGAAWAIDFNGCLFLNRLVAGRTERPETLPPTHLRAADPPPPVRLLPARTVARMLEGAPDAWFDGADRAALSPRVIAYFCA